MKKYYFKAVRKQLEKPTEPLYANCAAARCWVHAESEEEAYAKAAEKFQAEYAGSGMAVGEPVLTKSAELPVDWNYGYGDERQFVGAKEAEGWFGKEEIR